jgi:hypothetical protein
MKKREIDALRDAATRPGGWGLFMRKTTEKLAEQGLFVKEKHPSYGDQFKITESGMAAYLEATKDEVKSSRTRRLA